MRPVAVAGLSDIDPSGPRASVTTIAAWGVVLGLTLGIVVATLSIDPPKKRRT